MAAVERRFRKHKGVQIWKVVDGQDITYRSDPIDDTIFACSTFGEVRDFISICSYFGCVKSQVSPGKVRRKPLVT